MRDILLLAIHLLTALVKLLRPSGARAIVAESLILKHQLLILNRSRKSALHLTVRDRLLLGLANARRQPVHGEILFCQNAAWRCSLVIAPMDSRVRHPRVASRRRLHATCMARQSHMRFSNGGAARPSASTERYQPLRRHCHQGHNQLLHRGALSHG
jgi:hypothetical protein